MTGKIGATRLGNETTKNYLRSVIAETQQRLEMAERKINKYKILLEQERTKKEATTSYSGDMYYNGISRAVEVLDNTANAGIAVKDASAILRKTVKDVEDARIKEKHERSRRNEDEEAKGMEETIETIMQWHKETFPDTTLEEQMNKFELEAKEYDQATTREEKIKEFIDMNIVCYGIKRIKETASKPFEDRLLSIRADLRMTLGEHRRALENKMAINRKRKWHKVNGEYRHIDEPELLVCRMTRDEAKAYLKDGRVRGVEKNQ